MRAIAQSGQIREWLRGLATCGVALSVTLCLQAGAWTAETADPVPMSKTSIILKLDSDEPLAIRTKFQESPPTISVEFPSQRVIGSLPERAAVSKGIIHTITARYEGGSSRRAKRFLRSIQIGLTAPYP